MNLNEKSLNRRKFLKSSVLTGAFLGIAPNSIFANDKVFIKEELERLSQPTAKLGKSVMGMSVSPISQLRVAFIGVGNRGSGHVKRIQALHPLAKIVAVCDIREEQVNKSADFLKTKGQKVEIYFGKEDAWRDMMQRDDIDLVIIATPWEKHAPMSIDCMRYGKHVAVEVPAAQTLEDCWKLVNTAEETQRMFMMMENCCYGDEELWILNMVNQGVFGTLTHAEAAYIHDAKNRLFTNNYYNKWRVKHHETKNGNLYPTHGLGPVSQYLGVNRGDQFDYLVSMSSVQASLTEKAKDLSIDDEYYNSTNFEHGDMNSSLIKTHKGRSILLQHDVVTPRPYTRINALGGTKGYHEGYPSRLSLIEENGGHDWLSESKYQKMKDQYAHPVWEQLKKGIAENGGHGGMDYVMMYRLVNSFNKGLPLDMDVYDAANWSVVTPLSATSIQLGSAPVQFPDFTRGDWKKNRTLEMLKF